MRTRHHTTSIYCLPVVIVLMPAITAMARGPLGGADCAIEIVRTQSAPHRVFADSHFSIDDTLRRPYDPDVPMGCVGDRVWASSPQGWAFRDDVHWLYLTNLKAFDFEVRDGHGLIQPANATYYPSHVHLEGALRASVATASFTYTTDNAQNPLSKPFRPEKRWTCWSSKNRQDWYSVEFGTTRSIDGLRLFLFDDAPRGGCRPPESFVVERWDGAEWVALQVRAQSPAQPAKGENLVRFDTVETDRVRITFRNAGSDYYTGLYGFERIESAGKNSERVREGPFEIAGDKFITTDDILVSVLQVRNVSDKPQTVHVTPILDWEWDGEFSYRLESVADIRFADDAPSSPLSLWVSCGVRWHEQDVRRSFRFTVLDDPVCPIAVGTRDEHNLSGDAKITPLAQHLREQFKAGFTIPPGGGKQFKAALELKLPDEASTLDRILKPSRTADARKTRLSDLVATAKFNRFADRPNLDQQFVEAIPVARQDSRDALRMHIAEYESWFDSNLAYFDCSDDATRKMYYHRAYNLRKNIMDPKLGRMQWKAQSEGRWRSGWYPNVISYGGGHQVREARWLRDPSYMHGQLLTFLSNEKSDGVFPSHVKPAGAQGGQYTDWITSSAWDAHLVHPDPKFLAAAADRLADNVRGWQRVYDPDGDGLLLVDSHWWTGMEYQPSFFYFSGFRPAKDFSEPEHKVSLDRVDLTAYNFGNAVAVARIFRELGHAAEAAEFTALADKIATAVRTKMWDPDQRFFFSLNHETGAKADVKEVIGVYPFYFDMFPAGAPEHFESAWASILDREQFWTPWPVASASQKCPAYSQTQWPGDGRAAGCMWNGPTWPHANSIVLTAMARSLRASRAANPSGANHQALASPLKTDHLWELFHSFTMAQFRYQDLMYPWTGEFYNGETARWKTAERDYNHSTWLDVLIPDILGLIPRPDNVLEIDPLVPANALEYFVLDGQLYRGHDVTLVWDAPGAVDRYADGRKGFDVYLDGKLAASAPVLTRLTIDLETGRRLE